MSFTLEIVLFSSLYFLSPSSIVTIELPLLVFVTFRIPFTAGDEAQCTKYVVSQSDTRQSTVYTGSHAFHAQP
jgi:hypothetical protein